MLLGNLIQIGYSVVNTIWVGHLVGENAVGAAGVSFPVIFVTIGLAMGLTMGDHHPCRPVLRGERLQHARKGGK